MPMALAAKVCSVVGLNRMVRSTVLQDSIGPLFLSANTEWIGHHFGFLCMEFLSTSALSGLVDEACGNDPLAVMTRRLDVALHIHTQISQWCQRLRPQRRYQPFQLL